MNKMIEAKVAVLTILDIGSNGLLGLAGDYPSDELITAAMGANCLSTGFMAGITGSGDLTSMQSKALLATCLLDKTAGFIAGSSRGGVGLAAAGVIEICSLGLKGALIKSVNRRVTITAQT